MMKSREQRLSLMAERNMCSVATRDTVVPPAIPRRCRNRNFRGAMLSGTSGARHPDACARVRSLRDGCDHREGGPFTKCVRTFRARRSGAHCIDAHDAWALSRRLSGGFRAHPVLGGQIRKNSKLEKKLHCVSMSSLGDVKVANPLTT